MKDVPNCFSMLDINPRRNFIRLILLAITLVWAQPKSLGQTNPTQTRTVSAVASVGMTVSNMDQSVKFFTEVLDFQKLSDCQVSAADWTRVTGIDKGRVRQVELKLGEEILQLTQYLDQPGNPMPVDSRGNDHWFQHVAIIVNDMDAAYQRLRDHKVRHASSGPQTLPQWNKNAAGIKAFYLRDPDGHFLEVLQFPTNKGDPKWHRSQSDSQSAKKDLFLGIDHTAIVVADTDESLQLYRDGLGLRVAGTSENYGTEQEHLNGVFGARLRITTLRATQGPGIELLEYISPTDGRNTPVEIQPNDIAFWQVQLIANSPTTFTSAAGKSDSPDETQPASTQPNLIRDPDGHALCWQSN